MELSWGQNPCSQWVHNRYSFGAPFDLHEIYCEPMLAGADGPRTRWFSNGVRSCMLWECQCQVYKYFLEPMKG